MLDFALDEAIEAVHQARNKVLTAMLWAQRSGYSPAGLAFESENLRRMETRLTNSKLVGLPKVKPEGSRIDRT